MIRPLELFIGLRYTRSRRSDQFVSFISIMSTLGIVLGVAAMITVLSVMNGFGKELRQRILGVVSHATIESLDGRLRDWRRLSEEYLGQPDVTGVAPYINGQGLLTRGRKAQGVLVRGIDPKQEQTVSEMTSKLTDGSISDLVAGKRGVILGRTLAETLGVKKGSVVVLIHDRRIREVSSPKLYRLNVVGVFNVGMHRQDSALAVMHLEDASDIFGFGKTVSGLRIRLTNAYDARSFAYQEENRLGEDYNVSHWMSRHSNFFIALEDQKRIMFLVLMLVVSVAAFNIVSTLIMMVTDKQSDIAILRTIGMSPTSVMLIFVFQGMLIALIGILGGIGLGILLAVNSDSIVHVIEQILNVGILAPEIYPITDLPSDIRLGDIVNIVIAASAASFLSTLYPAWRAARTQPAMALRYE